jgi:8-oxo-dGTP pyrophosphatase MutT (NUDIX family)
MMRPESKQPIPPNAKKVYKGVIFDVWQWDQRLFDGSKTTFEKVSRGDSVVIFPILDDGKIVLNEQNQPGRKTFLSAAGGRIDSGESVYDAARRELLEETGMEAERFILWKAAQPVTEIDWASYVFVAKGVRKVAGLTLDSGENIKPMYVSFDEFLKIAMQDDFYEKEIQVDIFRALLDPKKMAELRDLFNPTK